MNNAVLIQQASGSHTYLLRKTHDDHSSYSLRFGFDFWNIEGSALTGKDSERHAFWNKVFLLQKAIDAGYKYVVWLDSDCWIADPNRDLREACPEDGFGLVWHGKPEWPEHKDCYDHYNAGAVYLTNGIEAQRLLKLWWNASDDGHFWHDQHALNAHAIPEFAKLWRRPAPIKELGYEWNAVPFPEFAHERPIVAAWHGFADVGQRLDAMTAYMQNTKFRQMLEGCDVREACQKADFCLSQGNLEGAAEFFKKAHELGVEGTDFLREYANCQIQRKQWGDAVTLLQEALEQEPENGLFWRMLSGCYDFLGEHELNGQAIEKAELYSPEACGVMLNKAFWKLRNGDWEEGFDLLRWDFVNGGRKTRVPTPEWDGEYIETLFVWCEQGLGDTLMLCRYLNAVFLDDDPERLIFEVQPPLVSLLRCQFPCVEIVEQTPDKSIPFQYDAHIGLFSLPALLNVTPEGEAGRVAYIKAPLDKVAEWAEVVSGDGLKIGFSWAGSEGHGNNVNRNMFGWHFDELVKTPGTSWYSLQHGLEIPQAIIDDTPEVTFIGQHCLDMADTAGIIANLDLIITVDSAILHLAGAMGVPAWGLISKSSDWRWLLDREDTVWYPSVRLFRQKTLGDWDEVIARVDAALKERLTGFEKAEEFRDWAEGHKKGLPLLSDEDINRESIYRERS